MNFAGKIVLIAGGTGGLGRSVSLGFLAAGASVITTYRNEEELTALKAASPEGSSLEGRSVDLTDEAAVLDLVNTIASHHGRLDLVVNTVGGFAGGSKTWETNLATFDQMFALNFRCGLLLARAAVPLMLSQKSGAFLNVASKSAVDYSAGLSAYSASKAGVLALFDTLAEELKGTGVRVNTVLPSIIDTDANRKAMPKADFSKWPKADDIARVILFLCSDEAKVIHGAAVPVYGA